MKIKSIRKSEEKQHTFDIEVVNDHHYILDNGCVSHNSSVVSSSTNGIEAPRKLISVKKSKSGSPLPVVVPEISKLKNKYSFSWGFTNDDMNGVVSIIQKYFDQGISVNHYYDKRSTLMVTSHFQKLLRIYYLFINMAVNKYITQIQKIINLIN